DDFYLYIWLSYEANNCNTVFIDGQVPALIDPGHARLFHHVSTGLANDGKDVSEVKLLIGTHSHPDHIEAMEYFGDDTLRAISKDEHSYLTNGGKELFLMTGCEAPKKPFTLLLSQGSFNLGDKEFTVIKTPGHSPGSVCLYWQEKRLLISGDTLFSMGIGRTDLTGSDINALKASIATLAELDIEYLVPGHGEIIRGKKVVERNFKMILGEFF
ncbi:MAG TPA: MBL fold metallo-hydrolase, partial [Syntrophorhabdaceae bacterium]|nr:MBL fold metallo-hydrolase [Syntrophorhabdaceae bacterium]